MRLCISILMFVCMVTVALPSSSRSIDTLRVDYIEHDTDLWTCGQLILFSSKEPVVWDEHGRVVSGMLGANTLILCTDNQFREFARGYHVSFDERGLLVSGTPAVSIEIMVQEQVVASMPYTEVSFYSNGVVRQIVPSDNFRYVAVGGSRFVVAMGNIVFFDEEGHLRSAVVARRRILQRTDGVEQVFQPGDVIKIDEFGRVE